MSRCHQPIELRHVEPNAKFRKSLDGKSGADVSKERYIKIGNGLIQQLKRENVEKGEFSDDTLVCVESTT